MVGRWNFFLGFCLFQGRSASFREGTPPKLTWLSFLCHVSGGVPFRKWTHVPEKETISKRNFLFHQSLFRFQCYFSEEYPYQAPKKRYNFRRGAVLILCAEFWFTLIKWAINPAFRSVRNRQRRNSAIFKSHFSRTTWRETMPYHNAIGTSLQTEPGKIYTYLHLSTPPLLETCRALFGGDFLTHRIHGTGLFTNLL